LILKDTNIDFNQDILHTVLESIHQRAIDLALKVIEKNNLTKIYLQL
jgi:hypothetical protein